MTAHPGGVKLHAELCEVLGALVLWAVRALRAAVLAPAFAAAVHLGTGALLGVALVSGVCAAVRPGGARVSA